MLKNNNIFTHFVYKRHNFLTECEEDQNLDYGNVTSYQDYISQIFLTEKRKFSFILNINYQYFS